MCGINVCRYPSIQWAGRTCQSRPFQKHARACCICYILPPLSLCLLDPQLRLSFSVYCSILILTSLRYTRLSYLERDTPRPLHTELSDIRGTTPAAFCLPSCTLASPNPGFELPWFRGLPPPSPTVHPTLAQHITTQPDVQPRHSFAIYSQSENAK
jgi:hypothetical protein